MSLLIQPFEPGLVVWPRVAAIRHRLTDAPADVRAVVVGAGASGLAALRLLRSRGVSVRMLDDRPRSAFDGPTQSALSDVELSPIATSTLESADLVVLSPGVPRTRPELDRAVEEGRLVGEVELASWFADVPLVGITGTNGKSTTTALVAHMLAQSGLRVFAGGNLGRPLSELSLGEPYDVAVVELSSYQLESVVEAHFRVACWLNLTPDHLDRYPSVAVYAAAKRRLIERRSINGTAVLNADDPLVRDVGRRLGGSVRWFSLNREDGRASTMGTFMADEEQAVRRSFDGGLEMYCVDGPALVGPHNRSNACAAIECARFLNAPPESVQTGLSTFAGLPHRLERVGQKGRTVFYNDSKATNVDAAVTAVRGVEPPIALIAGGVDKGGSWAPLVDAAAGRVARVFAIGEAAPIVARVFSEAGTSVDVVETVERAVEAAAQLGDDLASVLLAPACASFDQFANYGARGDAFRAAVRRALDSSGDSVEGEAVV